MTGFVVTAPSAPQLEEPIVSGPFWPNIDPKKVREAQRIDNTITPGRLRIILIEAIAATNMALRQWRDVQLANGITELAEIDADNADAKIDGTSILVHRYLRAIGCLAKALLLERYPDFDATGKGEKKADALTHPIDDCRRDHLHAVSDIVGRARTTVELI